MLALVWFSALVLRFSSSGKASASRAEDPGFESRLRRDFFGIDSKIGTQVPTLPGAWRCRVSAGTGRPGVSIL